MTGGLIADFDKASGDFRQPSAGTPADHVARLEGFTAPEKFEAKPWFKPIVLWKGAVLFVMSYERKVYRYNITEYQCSYD